MHFGSVCSGKSRTGRPAIDLLGQRFGRLLVVERVENDKRVDRPTGPPLTGPTSSTTQPAPNAGRQAQAQTPSSAAPRGRSSGAPINRRVIRRISLGCASASEEGSHDSHGKAMEKEASYPPAARRASSKPARHVRSVLPNAEALHPAIRAASACRTPSTNTRRAASRWGPWRRRRSWARA